jgi:hypothetical protein
MALHKKPETQAAIRNESRDSNCKDIINKKISEQAIAFSVIIYLNNTM